MRWDGAAQEGMTGFAGSVDPPANEGGATGADASRFWSYDAGCYAGIMARRCNVIFVLAAVLESTSALTKPDLAFGAGWQLSKVDAFASEPQDARRGMSRRSGSDELRELRDELGIVLLQDR